MKRRDFLKLTACAAVAPGLLAYSKPRMVTHRVYLPLPTNTKPLAEGITPSWRALTRVDVVAPEGYDSADLVQMAVRQHEGRS